MSSADRRENTPRNSTSSTKNARVPPNTTVKASPIPRIVSWVMDFDLTDEHQLIRETARTFADRELAERARENDRNHHFDLELVSKIADQGYLGAIVPQEYGGAGLDYLTYAIVVEEIGRHDS